MRIFVDNEDYEKLVNGKTLKVIVDSVGKQAFEAKLSFKDAKKKTVKKSESTGWDNPPRFNSMEERDLYYK